MAVREREFIELGLPVYGPRQLKTVVYYLLRVVYRRAFVATQRLTHAQREAAVLQELQGAFPGFVDVPSWAAVSDDPPDFLGQGPGGLVGLELVEWLDGTQMGVAQGRKTYREALGDVLAGGWDSEYQPMHLSAAVVCPFLARQNPEARYGGGTGRVLAIYRGCRSNLAHESRARRRSSPRRP
jgi:hypothetical protein